jgi:predicted RNA-binding Zn-ribbon protein involved in translation (DUF1610 family)
LFGVYLGGVKLEVNKEITSPECWKCKIKMELVEDELDGVLFHKYQCPNCGESITTNNQLTELTEKYKEKDKRTFKAVVGTWGGSLGIRIPTPLTIKYGISTGQRLILFDDGENIRMTKERHINH